MDEGTIVAVLAAQASLVNAYVAIQQAKQHQALLEHKQAEEADLADRLQSNGDRGAARPVVPETVSKET